MAISTGLLTFSDFDGQVFSPPIAIMPLGAQFAAKKGVSFTTEPDYVEPTYKAPYVIPAFPVSTADPNETDEPGVLAFDFIDGILKENDAATLTALGLDPTNHLEVVINYPPVYPPGYDPNVSPPNKIISQGQWRIVIKYNGVEYGSLIVDPTFFDESKGIKIPFKTPQPSMQIGDLLQFSCEPVDSPVPFASYTIAIWYKTLS